MTDAEFEMRLMDRELRLYGRMIDCFNGLFARAGEYGHAPPLDKAKALIRRWDVVILRQHDAALARRLTGAP